MRRNINNIISVIYTLIRFSLIKLFNFNKFFFHVVERISPNVVIEHDRGSRLTFGKKVRIHSGSKVKARDGAELTICDNAKINYNCVIVSHQSIHIGEGAELGPFVLIYDHDHDFRKGLKNKVYKCSPVRIGKNCWIGANTVILRGTVIGANSVVGAGSVIKGVYPENFVIYQKRITTTSKFIGEDAD